MSCSANLYGGRIIFAPANSNAAPCNPVGRADEDIRPYGVQRLRFLVGAAVLSGPRAPHGAAPLCGGAPPTQGGRSPSPAQRVQRSKGAQRGMPTLGRSERSGLCDDEAHDGSTLEGHVSPVRDARLPSVSKHKQPGLRPVLVCISCCGPSALLTMAQRIA